MTSVLLLLFEALALLTLGLDLGAGFDLLPATARILLAAAAAAAPVLILRRRDRRRILPGLTAPAGCLAAASVLLAVLGIAYQQQERRIAAQWDAGGRTRLENRARLLQEDFSAFLAELVAPIGMVESRPVDGTAGFEALATALRRNRLPAARLGASLYRADGTLLAWGGNSTPAPRDILTGGPGPRFLIGGSDLSPRLYAAGTSASSGLSCVAEFLLRPAPVPPKSAGGGPRFDFLPHWENAAPAHLHLARPGGADEMARFFERQGDRYWSQVGREGAFTLSFPLRGPGGEGLAVVTLKDRRAAREIAVRRAGFRRSGAILAAAAVLLAWRSLERARLRRAGARLVAGSLALWAVRLLLLAIGNAADLPRVSLFDIGLYASPALGGLLRSPGDLLMTSAVVLAQSILIGRWLREMPLPLHAPGRARLVNASLPAAGLLLAGGAWGLHRAIDRLVLDARLDLSRVEFDARWLPRTALHASLFFLVGAITILLVALIDVAARSRATRRARRLREMFGAAGLGRLPLPLRFSGGVLVLTLLYTPLLHHAYDRLRREFFEEDLLPRVVDQKERRAQTLRDALAQAEEEDFALKASFAAEEETASGSVAYRLWTATPLAETGLASSLQIFDSDGRRLDRFAVNLAPGLEVPFATASAAAGGDLVEVPPRPHAIVRKPILFGSRFLRAPRRAPLLVVISLIDDYDNLPIAGAETGHLQMFRARALPNTNPEILRGDPMVAVFGPPFERLYASGGEIPPPGDPEIRRLGRGEPAWASTSVAGRPARILYARGQGVVFALGMPHAGAAEILASTLRLVLLNGAIAALLLGARRLVRRRDRAAERPRTTFYARLTAIVLLTALVPLLALAFFVTRFSAREFERELTVSALASLEVARRVAEDYLSVGGEDPVALDDDALFWISRVVRQDLNVYRGASLAATSTPELFSSGLLNARLDGAVYRALHLEHAPFLQSGRSSGAPESMTLSAQMRIDADGTIGVLSIPIAGRRRAAERREEEVDDAVLISTCLTVLLLAAASYLVARRVSEPIAQLARAARRVAAGDLEVRVAASARDEIGLLVETFNSMASSVRQQREDLRRRRDYIETILRSATLGVISVDAAGAVSTINPAAQRLLGDICGTLEPGASLPDRLAGGGAPGPLRTALLRALERPEEAEVELVLARGAAERRLRAALVPFAPGEGAPAGIIVLLEDITEIVRSGRLAAWADMARRIAHEIKNPLTPIQLSVEHARRLWQAGDERFGEVLPTCLDNIQRQVRELRRIASGFSDYARLPEIRPAPVGAADVLDDALAPYRAAPPPGVIIRRDVEPGLPPILADRAVLARALVNLLENALQAMPAGGVLRLAALPGAAPGGGVVLEVSDTGAGIDPATLSRIFEPYFSTRSGGTGLGLAIVRRTVEDHGGTIHIDSRPGAGTTVRLVLPAAHPSGGEEVP